MTKDNGELNSFISEWRKYPLSENLRYYFWKYAAPLLVLIFFPLIIMIEVVFYD